MLSPKEVNERLFAYRTFRLVGDITGSVQEHFCQSLVLWNLDSTDPIKLIIDSRGGDLHIACWMIDAIRFSKAPVHAIVTAVAESAAFGILQACHRRIAYPSARLVFHYGTLTINLDTDRDPREFLEESLQRVEGFLEHFSKLSGKDIGTIRSWARQARRMNSDEALKLNFIDEILTPPA